LAHVYDTGGMRRTHLRGRRNIDFSFCVELRGVGDYGTEVRIDAKQATDAIASARRILVAVRDALPVDFPPGLAYDDAATQNRRADQASRIKVDGSQAKGDNLSTVAPESRSAKAFRLRPSAVPTSDGGQVALHQSLALRAA